MSDRLNFTDDDGDRLTSNLYHGVILIEIETRRGDFSLVRLEPDEARQLAQHLVLIANMAEER
jgi:hypothetical protein